MEGGSAGHLHEEVRSLKRSLHRFTIGVTVLSVVVVAIFIALIAVGASQHNSIKNLRARAGIIKDPKVAFAIGSTDRNIQGLNYGGSLFRGSGFWSTRKGLPGIFLEVIQTGLTSYFIQFYELRRVILGQVDRPCCSGL